MEFTLQHLITFQSFVIESMDRYPAIVITQDEVLDAIEGGNITGLIEDKYNVSLSDVSIIHHSSEDINIIFCGENYDPIHHIGVKNDNHGSLLIVAIINKLLMYRSDNGNFYQEQKQSYEEKFGV